MLERTDFNFPPQIVVIMREERLDAYAAGRRFCKDTLYQYKCGNISREQARDILGYVVNHGVRKYQKRFRKGVEDQIHDAFPP